MGEDSLSGKSIEIDLCAAVDAAFDAQIEATVELVRARSLRGHEHLAQDVVERLMAQTGLSPVRQQVSADLIRALSAAPKSVEPMPGAYNVFGRIVGAGGGKSLILNGHVDVVPAETSERWSRDPFDAYVREGKLFGRGSADMKAGVVANIFAARALMKCGLRLKGDLHVQSVVEEEYSGNGALAAALAGPKADAVLISEPVPDAVLVAQMGVMWVRVLVDGVPAHAGFAMHKGNNAIDAAYSIWSQVRRLEGVWNSRSDQFPPFDKKDNPVAFVIGMISGGDWPSSVPARCVIDFRCSVFPGQNLAEARTEIEVAIQSAAEDLGIRDPLPVVTYPGLMAEGYAVRDATEFQDMLRRAHSMASSKELTPIKSTFGCDGRFFGLYAGTPALMYGPMGERLHGIDECVDLASLRQVTKAIAILAAEWCGAHD
jgi:acetylornithine deacetylase